MTQKQENESTTPQPNYPLQKGDFIQLESYDSSERRTYVWDRAEVISVSSNHIRIKSHLMVQKYLPKYDRNNKYVGGAQWPVGSSQDTLETVKIDDIRSIRRLSK